MTLKIIPVILTTISVLFAIIISIVMIAVTTGYFCTNLRVLKHVLYVEWHRRKIIRQAKRYFYWLNTYRFGRFRIGWHRRRSCADSIYGYTGIIVINFMCSQIIVYDNSLNTLQCIRISYPLAREYDFIINLNDLSKYTG